eukprot:SM000148S01023  [mRNA]  locus=s148:157341:161683:- [translate_table: standard]
MSCAALATGGALTGAAAGSAGGPPSSSSLPGGRAAQKPRASAGRLSGNQRQLQRQRQRKSSALRRCGLETALLPGCARAAQEDRGSGGGGGGGGGGGRLPSSVWHELADDHQDPEVVARVRSQEADALSPVGHFFDNESITRPSHLKDQVQQEGLTAAKKMHGSRELEKNGSGTYRRQKTAALATEAPLLDSESGRVASSASGEVQPWKSSLRHVLVAVISTFLFGYHVGVVNGPLDYMAVDLGFAANALIKGLVVSIYLVGAFIGCAFSSTIADNLGRKRAFQLSAIPIIAGSAISASAMSVEAMLAGRLLVGLGLGVVGSVSALYISEVSPTEQRGTFGSLCQVATCLGILGAIVIGLPVTSDPTWWRMCFWVSIGPAVMLVAGMELSAESPRWLAKKGKWDAAERELEVLWGPSEVKGAITELKDASSETTVEGTLGDLFGKRYVKVVATGAALFAFQQLSGINAIFYFSSIVFKNAGISSGTVASIGVGVINLVGAFASTYMMDRLGRKKLMSLSFSGMVSCAVLTVAGIAMAAQAAGAAFPIFQPVASAISIGGTLAYVFMFALGAGPVPALLLPEIYPSRIRAKAMGFAMCLNWALNFLVGLFFLQLLQQWGPAALYSSFAAVCGAAVVFVNGQVVETKGKSLEEIERLLTPEL